MSLNQTRRVTRRFGAVAGRVTASVAAMSGAGLALVVAGSADPAAAATAASVTPGYWLAAADGGVYSYDAQWLGALRGTPLNRPIVGAAATPDGQGYWMVGSDGGVFSYGDAHFYGSTGGIRLNQPIVGMAADPATGGYWMVAADGGVFSYNAPFLGSTGGMRLNQPIVGMAPTPDGQGYWLVAADGGIFAFGDARFYGSTGGIHLNQPIVGMAATPDGHGYWLVARDGGIFSYGDAQFFGSTGGMRLAKPIIGMAATSDGRGYWLAAADGGVFTFGDAPFLGSAGASGSPIPFTAIMATTHGSVGATHGDGMPLPGTIGYDVSRWQCGGLPAPRNFAVVQVSGGSIDGGPNPCYAQQAAWAGQNMSAYIFGDHLPSPAPPESLSGPGGICNGNTTCQGYNFGYYWARHWVAYSQSVGVDPAFWWLDVETGYWSSDLTTNAAVIRGAIDGLHSTGAGAGIYSTSYQWPRIAGSLTFPGIPIWAAGADYVTGDAYSATAFCTNGGFSFAGGRMTLVQYGYGVAGGPAQYDPDYACG